MIIRFDTIAAVTRTYDNAHIIDSRSQRLYDIWISESPDLVYWGKSEPLLCVEDIPYANERLGAGTPPVRTEHG